VVVLLTVVLVGCGDDTDDPPPAAAESEDTSSTETTLAGATEPFAFDVTSVDFGYELATSEVPAGPVQVTQVNAGEEEHQVTLMRLDGGMTPDELATIIAEEGDDALDPSIFAGGPNNIPPGESNTALVELTAGDHVAYCFLPDHARQGMIEPFTVTDGGEVSPPAVEPAATIALDDFEFVVPQGFAGQGTIEVVNEGAQAHEWTILGAQAVGRGGLTAIAPGTTGYADVDLAPGQYTFVCFVLDPETQSPHVELGMTTAVTIA
jgi:uncharacterized cupredoxin-like copper-binding protein